MVVKAVLTLTLFVGASLAAPPVRIVNGTVTSTSVHPSIVQLDMNGYGGWTHGCGGNILTNLVVLSAAHCTHIAFDPFYRPENRRIRAGADYRNVGGQIVYVQSVLNHPSFNITTFDADICIIRLSSFLTFGNNISYISIMPQNFTIPDNSVVVHAGWGATSSNGPPSDVLLEVTIFKINLNECTRRYANATPPATVTQNMICAGILDVGGKDACFGDSGGPLYYQNILAGLVSWGPPFLCADPVYPGVSTRIASYSDWIVVNA